VTVEAAGVVVAPSGLSFYRAGAKKSFTVSQASYSGTFAAASSDQNVATVADTSTGRFEVAAVGPGSCTLTITGQGGKTATVSVRVMTTQIVVD
jgi:hypothetical protein